MLKLLRDEHISPVIAHQLRAKHRKLTALALLEWEAGQHLGLPDSELLRLAATQGLTLVTYDQRTITPLLKEWAESSVSHAGVIFVDERTIAPNDFGGLISALSSLWKVHGSQSWKDWVIYLRRQED